MVSHRGHQGADQMDVLPAWSCVEMLLWSSLLTYMTYDQKMDLVPLVLAVQKEELG